MKPARRPARYDLILDVPDTKVAEIIDGELIVSPRPASPHANSASAILVDVRGSFHGPPREARGPGGWWILMEPELHFGDDVIVPDQGGWRCERMPTLLNVAAFTLAPDWVCEVVSPSTGRIDRGRKMRIYAREGVASLWLVDPLLRTIEIYELRDGEWVAKAVHGGDEPARLAPFDAVELEVARWWIDNA
jgi:Uma2 family endonuclease